MNKYLIGLLIVVLTGITYLGVSYPKANLGASPAGSTFGDAKQAMIAINLAAPGANATSTSILNSDGNDRFITSEEVSCEGVGTSKTAYTGAGLASLTLTVATSSTAAPASNANSNTLPVITIATSTAYFGIASSTVGAPGNSSVSNVWAANSDLTFTANATNTALCTVGVKYIGL